jgi:hypothetical protein
MHFVSCHRLAATVVVGAMYEKLGRMMGRSYEETVQVSFSFLIKIKMFKFHSPASKVADPAENERPSYKI